MRSALLRCAPLVLAGAGLLASAGATAGPLPPLLPATAQAPLQPDALPAPGTRNGQEILQRFRAGLASPVCDAEATSERWKTQFRHAGQRLADPSDPLLPLFGYVVDELHSQGLPTEFALIPFVESGYRTAAASRSGPAGLWQFVASTARHHKVPMGGGLDGRLSAVESTEAALRYLSTLYGIFGGRWELAVMGYNAGEYRILQALRREGLNAGNAPAEALARLSPGTYAYVEKIHALSCLLEEASASPVVMAALDREVPVLTAVRLPAGTRPVQWAEEQALPAEELLALNPLLSRSALPRPVTALVPATPGLDPAATTTAAPLGGNEEATAATAPMALAAATERGSRTPRRHTVRSGESLWAIARRHGMALGALLSLNDLDAGSILRPGMVLRLDP